VASPFAFLDHPGPIAFAHRGGAGGGRENTMAAFADAVALGYRYVETDVHATSDGRLVAFHDRTLDRVTDGVGAIAKLPWDKVAMARIAAEHGVPLLEDVFEEFPFLRINIDVKADGAVDPLAQMIRRTGVTERVCVGSFSDARLARVRAAVGPRLCTSMGPREVFRLWRRSWLRRRPHDGGGACVQVPPRAAGLRLVDERFLSYAHDCGLPVHVWTVDAPAEITRLLDVGVDGIMTDEPAILREILIARGQWPH
jgi:glycerophosphoryl diester phosphodiesterase